MNSKNEQSNFYICEISSIEPLKETERTDIIGSISVNIELTKQYSKGDVKIDSLISSFKTSELICEYNILETGNFSMHNCINILSEIIYQHLSRHSQLIFNKNDIEYEFKSIPCIEIVHEKVKDKLERKLNEIMKEKFFIELGNLYQNE